MQSQLYESMKWVWRCYRRNRTIFEPLRKGHTRAKAWGKWVYRGTLNTMVSRGEAPCIKAACVLRLAYGEFAEEVVKWLVNHTEHDPGVHFKDIESQDEIVVGSCGCCFMKKVHAYIGGAPHVAHLHQLSYHAALWTSMHAESLSAICSSSHPINARAYVLPNPMLVESDIGVLAEERKFQCAINRPCNRMETDYMQALSRCAWGSATSWRKVCGNIAGRSLAIRITASRAIRVCLTGLHRLCHPCARPGWRDRMLLSDMIAKSFQCSDKMYRKWFDKCSGAVYSALQLLVRAELLKFNILSSYSNLVLSRDCAPNACALPSVHCADMSVFFEVGRRVRCREADVVEALNTLKTFSKSIVRVRKRSNERQKSATEAISSLLLQSFQHRFLPVWLQQHSIGIRLTYLSDELYDVLHTQSSPSAAILSASTPADVRYVLDFISNTPASHKYTLNELCSRMFGERAQTRETRTSCAIPTLDELTSLSSEQLLRVFIFVSLQYLNKKIVTDQLDSRTHTMQYSAVRRKMRLQHLLPATPRCAGKCRAHKRCLDCVQLCTYCTVYICTCCNRFCNASVRHPRVLGRPKRYKETSEYGVVSVMNNMTAESSARPGSDLDMYCARRPPSSLKSITATRKRTNESHGPCAESSTNHDTDLDSSLRHITQDSGCVSHMRRDTQQCYHQSNEQVNCHKRRLIGVDVLGASCTYNRDITTLCCFCANVIIFKNNHTVQFFESLPCCTACHMQSVLESRASAVLPGDAPTKTHTPTPKGPTMRVCHFCHKTESADMIRFQTLYSPQDESPVNIRLPPSMRYTHWCRLHYREWMRQGLETMKTADVFAHIIAKAKPINRIG